MSDATEVGIQVVNEIGPLRDVVVRRPGLESRGCGRVGISLSNPPTPIAAISAAETGTPQATRSSTQSAPFSAGLRAQPRARRAARAPRRA